MSKSGRSGPPKGGQGGPVTRSGVPSGLGGPTSAPAFARAAGMGRDKQLTMPTPSAPDRGQAESPAKGGIASGHRQSQGGRRGAGDKTGGSGAKE